MGKIIIASFRPSRLPRRLLNDGWWLETPSARRAVVAFPKRDAAKPKSESNSKFKPRVRHLTVVTSGK
jgi:hypothetical protein